MTYQEANYLLQGRCKERRKIARNTYLERLGASEIGVLFHSTYVVRLRASGEFTLNTGGYHTRTTHDRIARFCPHGQVRAERGASVYSNRCGGEALIDREELVVRTDGSFDDNGALAQHRESVRQADKEHNREQARLAYWIRQGRQHLRGRLTREAILAEGNISIRMAKMHAFGLERFLQDGEVLDESKDYRLIELEGQCRVLEMRCPSTSAVYVQTVPPWLGHVEEALDWIFDTTDYLGQVTQAT